MSVWKDGFSGTYRGYFQLVASLGRAHIGRLRKSVGLQKIHKKECHSSLMVTCTDIIADIVAIRIHEL